MTEPYKSIANKTIMFTNLNTWRNGDGNDLRENFLADCIDDKVAFENLRDLSERMGLTGRSFFKLPYTICVLLYETYASCSTREIDNQKYMWDKYTTNGGVCVIYDDRLLDHLKDLHGKINQTPITMNTGNTTYKYRCDMWIVDYKRVVRGIKNT